MYYKKKEKLYISELLESPLLNYPSYYTLSAKMAKNDYLHSAIIALHTQDFTPYAIPKEFDTLFTALQSGLFAIYKEQYIIGYFGEKMMFLEPNGWHALPAVKDIFTVENWLI